MRPPVRLISLSDWYRGNADPLRFVASVDYETDKKIQDTIASEFEDRTILCIARKFSVSRTGSERDPLTTDLHLRLQTDFKLSLATTGFASSTLAASLNSIPRRGCSTRRVAFSAARATVPRFRLRTFEELPSYGRREHFAIGFWDFLTVDRLRDSCIYVFHEVWHDRVRGDVGGFIFPLWL
jgi:hypothetical protein